MQSKESFFPGPESGRVTSNRSAVLCIISPTFYHGRSAEQSVTPAGSQLQKSVSVLLQPSALPLDSFTILLIAVNLSMIIVAVWEQWEIGVLIWIYWFQSVIIGLFQFLKIITLKNFSTSGLLVNGRSVEATTKTLWSTGLFFLFHYGFFHMGYLVFLLVDIPITAGSRDIFVPGALFFLLNHAFSFVMNYWADTGRQQNLGRVLFIPYARIIPMHLANHLRFRIPVGIRPYSLHSPENRR